MALATHSARPVWQAGSNSILENCTGTPPVAYRIEDIRNDLNDGQIETLLKKFQNAGNIELDFSENPLNDQKQPKTDLHDTKLGLQPRGLKTLAALLTDSKVTITKLVLGYVSGISDILQCLPQAQHLRSLDLGNMTVLKPNDPEPYYMGANHVALLGEFFSKLHSGAPFVELLVKANIKTSIYEKLADFNRQFAKDGLSTAVKFVDLRPESVQAKATALRLINDQNEACRHLLALLNNGDTEGFKEALKDLKCSPTVLDLRTCRQPLDEQGAAALGAVLCDQSVHLKTVVIGSAATIDPILQALPFCTLDLLDLTKARTLISFGDFEKSCTLTGQQVCLLQDASTTRTEIRLNSKDLNKDCSEKLELVKQSGLKIVDIYKPKTLDDERREIVEKLNKGRIRTGVSHSLTAKLDISNPDLLLTSFGMADLADILRGNYNMTSLTLGRVESLDALMRLHCCHLPDTLDLSKTRICTEVHGVPTAQPLLDAHARALAYQIEDGNRTWGVKLQTLCIDTSEMSVVPVRMLVDACDADKITLKDIGPVVEQVRREAACKRLLDMLNTGNSDLFLEALAESPVRIDELDLRVGELNESGIRALVQVVQLASLPFKKVIVGKVDELGPILTELPKTSAIEIDLSNLSVWSRTDDDHVPVTAANKETLLHEEACVRLLEKLNYGDVEGFRNLLTQPSNRIELLDLRVGTLSKQGAKALEVVLQDPSLPFKKVMIGDMVNFDQTLAAIKSSTCKEFDLTAARVRCKDAYGNAHFAPLHDPHASALGWTKFCAFGTTILVDEKAFTGAARVALSIAGVTLTK